MSGAWFLEVGSDFAVGLVRDTRDEDTAWGERCALGYAPSAPVNALRAFG